jgi:hypothetical protein
MTVEIQSGLISRRTAFSLIGAAIGLALPASILLISEADAQTPGMERREDRREGRQGRREDRRAGRRDRRDDRRAGRRDRREDRQDRREDRRESRQDRREERNGLTTGTAK